MATQTISIVNTLDDILYNGGLETGYLQWGGPTDTGGCSFIVTTEIPAGSTIDSAYFRAYRTNVDSATGTARIAVENADPATNTRFSATHTVQTATCYSYAETASVNWIDYRDRWVFGNGDSLQTAITSQIASLLSDYGTIAVNDRINIRITGSGSYFARAEDYGDAGTNHAQLIINWTPGAASAVPPGILTPSFFGFNPGFGR